MFINESCERESKSLKVKILSPVTAFKSATVKVAIPLVPTRPTTAPEAGLLFQLIVPSAHPSLVTTATSKFKAALPVWALTTSCAVLIGLVKEFKLNLINESLEKSAKFQSLSYYRFHSVLPVTDLTDKAPSVPKFCPAAAPPLT